LPVTGDGAVAGGGAGTGTAFGVVWRIVVCGATTTGCGTVVTTGAGGIVVTGVSTVVGVSPVDVAVATVSTDPLVDVVVVGRATGMATFTLRGTTPGGITRTA